ncbi:MAG TPA: tetratricopeptide repeat protein [Myxococcaceae bacterium]|jgi:tetratricopeptide (TPR) repeat protein|nr:tetratricopeptide repeat protein [Myxococcaceae bacterium]
MYNLLIALAVGLAVAVAVLLAHLPWYAAIVPGFLAFAGAFLLLARRVGKKVKAIMELAQKELSVQPTSQRDQKRLIEKAVKTLESALPWEKWQPFIGGEIHAQIGMVQYMVKDYAQAEPHLRRAGPRNGLAQGLLAALHYQRKQYPEMEKAFEGAVKSSRKEGVVWAAYAWCLVQLKERDKALKVLSRAVEANKSDEKLKAGLVAVQNDKRLKMKAWEPLWWQFGLEAPPELMSGGRQVRFQRR